MKYCSNKDINKLVRGLIREGWKFRYGSKHGKLTHPSGKPTLTISKSPSDYRGIYNFLHDLRKIA